MKLCRQPRAPLRPFIDLIWASAPEATQTWQSGRKELVLPTGAAHFVLRLEDVPLRLFSDFDDVRGCEIGTSVIGGARASFYIKEVSTPVPTVGAMLRPGAIQLCSRAPAIELAGRHVRIDDLWSRSDLADMIDQLREAPNLVERLNLLEDILLARLPRVHAVHPLIAHALRRFDASSGVEEVANETGFSQRHFARTFKEWVGLSPKTYARVQRFGRILARMDSGSGLDLADIAAQAGYADQAHMTREFRTFAGVTPMQYTNVGPPDRHHLAI